LILHADFGSVRLTAMVALTLLFALIGGVVGAVLGGGVLSIGSLVRFVTVLGIAARNGIMLVSHYRHFEIEEGEPFGPGPILITALSTGLALLPLALAGDQPGQEIEHPLDVVIPGGRITSTLLNLFLLPALYAAFGKSRGDNGADRDRPAPEESGLPVADGQKPALRLVCPETRRMGHGPGRCFRDGYRNGLAGPFQRAPADSYGRAEFETSPRCRNGPTPGAPAGWWHRCRPRRTLHDWGKIYDLSDLASWGQ